MKSKKKRIFGILLSLALALSLMPVLGLSLTAYAGIESPSISVIPENSGSVDVSYDSGNFTLTATASEGKAFDHWSYSNDGSPETGKANPWTVNEHTIRNFSDITAHFVDAYPLWVGGTQLTSANASNILGNDTASYNESTNTLTLNGATITTGYDDSGIYYNGKDQLNIVLADGSVNTIEKNEEYGLENGIFVDDSSSDPAGLAISGKGKLTVSGGYNGICANYSEVSISGSTVTAIGGWDGIYAYSGIDIIDSTVTTEGGDGIYVNGNVNISGGNVNATGKYSGINAEGSVTINSGNIEAEGRYGITGELVTINDGTVNATGMNNELHASGMSTMKVADPAGIWADGAVEIKGGKVIAAGDGFGILGTVKNHIDGTGWTDKAGTQGKTAIAINTEGQDLSTYKNVQFPAKSDPATVTTKPAARNLTYTGKAQALVTAGKVSGGTMQYALGKDSSTAPTTSWSASIPAATNAGTYYVWYKPVGDSGHEDSKPACVKATIAKKPEPKPTPKPTPKKPQTVGKTTVRNTVANTAKKNSVVIYDAVPGATGYDIAYKNKNSGKWVIKKVGKTTRATIGGLTVGGMYQIKVRAKKAETAKYKAATGAWSPVVNRYFHTTQKIRLASKAKRSFTMSWKKNPQATGYQVMFSTKKDGSGAARNINTVGKNATSFTKVGLKSGKTYYVQVREIKKVGGVNYIGNISKPVPVKIK